MKPITTKSKSYWTKIPLIGLLALVGLNACEYPHPNPVDPNKSNPLIVDKNFNFATTKEIKIDLTAKDAKGNPLKMSKIQVFDKDPEQGGKLLLTGSIDNNGKFNGFTSLPTYLTEVHIETNYAGVLDKVLVPIDNQTITYNFSLTQDTRAGRLSTLSNARVSAGVYNFLGSFTTQGVPAYLQLPNDVVDAELLNAINTSLPDKQLVNPAYLASDVSRDIKLVKNTNVSITFISEGARNKNVLGYYTYPLDNPPAKPTDIKEKVIVFPNVSFRYSGGGLVSGNKVKLPGPIPAGTGIGFFIVADGWTGTGVSEEAVVYYSNPSFNPESTPDKKQHSVLLNNQGKYILAFEDMHRDKNADNDFNDVVFYVTTDTPNAVDDGKIPPVDTPKDCDKDGIPDADDNYPCDPVRAYDNFSEGTLAFEDLWPNKGDFDMNDLVLNYKHNLVTNSHNKVVEIKSDFNVVAIGARFKNGFGIEFSKLTPSQVASITSTYEGSELEPGQANATIIVFDNAFKFVPSGNDAMVNTYLAQSKVTCGSVSITTTLNSPLTMQEVGAAPFNPFLIANEQRGYEVHLPGYKPTSKADVTILGTKDDVSKPAEGLYYKTKEGMPFALHLPVGSFQYPVEMSAINEAFLKFAPWATSGGTLYTDWYLNLPEYGDETKIYIK